MRSGKTAHQFWRQNVITHGNSLRALSKYKVSLEDIINLEMKTGQPVIYDFDEKLMCWK